MKRSVSMNTVGNDTLYRNASNVTWLMWCFWSFCGKKISRVSYRCHESAEAVYLSASSGQGKQNNGTMKYVGWSESRLD